MVSKLRANIRERAIKMAEEEKVSGSNPGLNISKVVQLSRRGFYDDAEKFKKQQLRQDVEEPTPILLRKKTRTRRLSLD